MTFSEYLISKKIDEKAFADAEASLFQEWKYEFERMHPNSFTMQKLNLINPIRRKYPLTSQVENTPPPTPPASPAAGSKAIPKPVFKPKPKIN